MEINDEVEVMGISDDGTSYVECTAKIKAIFESDVDGEKLFVLQSKSGMIKISGEEWLRPIGIFF